MREITDSQELNRDDKHKRYCAKCRCCGEIETWVAFQTPIEWGKFYTAMMQNRFPHFMSYCQYCENEAVFDLVGITKREES